MQIALDFIEAHGDEPPTIEAICRASGASRRTLIDAFRDQFGVTPKQYLQSKRFPGAGSGEMPDVVWGCLVEEDDEASNGAF